ncbi:hypothetical protein Prudu_012577, partial [Prunus dulcis]
ARRKESVDTEWARIGVETKKLWSKSLSGVTVNISKLHLYKPRLCAKRAADFQKVLAPPRAPMATGPVALEPPSSPLPQPRDRPELAGKSCFPTDVRSNPPELPARFSPSILHQIDRAPGARQNYRRDLRGIEKCIGSTTGPLLTSTLQSQVKFWDWSKYRGDSAEFSAEV